MMNVVEVHINGFGQLHQVKLSLKASLVIIYGKNEAGKSTLYRFIHTMMFGFAKKNDSQRFLPPIAGGAHGGSIIIEAEDGMLLKLTRYKEQHQGKAQVTHLKWDEDNKSYTQLTQAIVMEQEQLERKYFHHISSSLFQQLSTISLSELQAATVMDEQELSQYLYHASWESGKYVVELERELQAEQEKLYKHRGQNQVITQQLKQLEQVEQQLKKAEHQLEQFVHIQAELEQTQQQLTLLDEELIQQQEAVMLVKGALSQRQLWLQQQHMEQQLDSLAQIGMLPNSFSVEVEQIVQRYKLLTGELHKLELEAKRLKEAADAIELQEHILSYAGEVEHYEQLSSAIMELEQLLEQRRVEAVKLTELIEELYEQIPDYWEEEQLRALEITHEQREAYENMQLELEKATALRQQYELEQQQLREHIHIAERELGMYEEKVNAKELEVKQYRDAYRFIPNSLHQLQQGTVLLQEAYRQYDYDKAHLGRASSQQQMRLVKKAPQFRFTRVAIMSTFIMLLISSIAVFIFAIGEAYAAWLLPLLFVATVTMSVFTAREWTTAKGSHKEWQQDEQELKGVYRAVSAIVEQAEHIHNDNYYSYRSNLQEQLSQLEILMKTSLELRELAQQKQQQHIHSQAKLQAFQLKLTELERTEQLLAEQWARYVAELHLPKESQLTQFENVIRVYRTFQHHFASRVEQLNQIAQYNQKIADYYTGVQRLFELNWNIELETEDPLLQLREMSSCISYERQQKNRKMSLLERLDEQLTNKLAYEPALEEVSQKLQRLFTMSKTAEIEELQYAASEKLSYEQLQKEAQVVQLQLQSGRNEKQQLALYAILQHYDEDQLIEKQNNEQLSYNTLLEQQQKLLQAKGSLLQQQDTLLSSNSHQHLLMEREAIQARLATAVEAYMKMSMEKQLLKQTKEKYEQERQPEVLLKAAHYFEVLTNGQYTQIIGDADRKMLQLRAADGSIFDSEQLSRGASELLYLCIRLALHEVSTSEKSLPLLLDDPCVNLDAERLASTMNVLVSLTKHRQLIYFTCHQYTAQKLQKLYPSAELITIEKEIAYT